MRLAGIVFIMVSAISVGARVAAILRKRCTHMRQLLRALQLLKNELLFAVVPLPKAFSIMSASAEGSLSMLFRDVSQRMEENRWMSPKTAMEKSLDTYPDDVSGDILLELSGKLGKYDLDAQVMSIDFAMERTQKLLNCMEEERSVKSKTYKTLSICAGMAIVILLL